MSRQRALIVDDEPDIRELLEITLGRMKLDTRSARNVKEARDWLAREPFDLCLTDMRLPDGTGMELVQHIQQRYPHVPVAMITAYGSLDTAINALKSASAPHAFMGINQQGQVALLQTQGNPDGHVILRGGKHPNYDSVNVSLAEEALEKAGLLPGLVVDCSHGNSSKDHRLQPKVADNVIHQIQEGNRSIIGVMLESNLFEGNQSSEQPKEQMRYGVSITDACIDWDSTAALLERCHRELAAPLKGRTAR